MPLSEVKDRAGGRKGRKPGPDPLAAYRAETRALWRTCLDHGGAPQIFHDLFRQGELLLAELRNVEDRRMPKGDPVPDVLGVRVPVACKLLGIGQSTLLRLIKIGEIEVSKPSPGLVIVPVDGDRGLRAFIARHTLRHLAKSADHTDD